MASADTFRDQTRATKFQQKFTLPPCFADVLKDYTREVLRKQPEDIYAWSSQYFTGLALKEDGVEGGAAGARGGAAVPEGYQKLSGMLEAAFAEYDSERSGHLFPHLMKRVLIDSAGLTTAQALFVLSSPSVAMQLNGTLDYTEVAADPSIVQQVAYFQKTGHEFDDPFRPDATAHGLSLDELQGELTSAFANAAAGGGMNLEQYMQALMTVPVQLTRRDINLLVLETPLDGDGHVQIGEYTTLFNLLLQAAVFTEFESKMD